MFEDMADAQAEHYSAELSVNIRRGINHNAQRALSNGRKVFGFVTSPDKRYALDPETAPVVAQMFADYAAGKSMQKIAHEVNATGVAQ